MIALLEYFKFLLLIMESEDEGRWGAFAPAPPLKFAPDGCEITTCSVIANSPCDLLVAYLFVYTFTTEGRTQKAEPL